MLPTATTITDLSYPGARNIYVYAKGEHFQAKPAIKQFIAAYAKSTGTGGMLQKRGLVPFGPAEAASSAAQATALKPLDPASIK